MRIQLGIPTANIPLDGVSVGGKDDIESGVYFGWAGLSPSDATAAHPPGNKGTYELMKSQVYDSMNKLISGAAALTGSEGAQQQAPDHSKGSVYPMVMSIGFNPFYNNTVRSVEVHIMHDFKIDFYETHMNITILGFIRGEYDYTSKQALIDDIKTDIDVAGKSLAREPYMSFAKDPYLLEFEGRTEIAS